MNFRNAYSYKFRARIQHTTTEPLPLSVPINNNCACVSGIDIPWEEFVAAVWFPPCAATVCDDPGVASGVTRTADGTAGCAACFCNASATAFSMTLISTTDVCGAMPLVEPASVGSRSANRQFAAAEYINTKVISLSMVELVRATSELTSITLTRTTLGMTLV